MNRFHKITKGQAVVTDLLIAAGVFILLITITIGTWDIYKIRLASRIEYDQMSMRGYHAIESLVRTPGYPENWEDLAATNLDAVRMFGLADADHLINHNKLIALMSIQDTAKLKDILNIGPYSFLLRLKKPGPTEQIIYSFGSKPTNEKAAVSLSRVVVYNDDVHLMEMIVYR